MINVYDATGDKKREMVELSNQDIAYWKREQPAGINDLVMVRTTNQFPINGIVEPIDEEIYTGKKSSNWTLNGANLRNKDFIIVEPFEEQINNPGLSNINEADTWFEQDVKLSKKAIILIRYERYKELCKNPNFKKEASKLNIALFRGEEDMALKMLLLDKRFAWYSIGESGFIFDEQCDTEEFGEKLKVLEKQLAKALQCPGRNVTYGKTQSYLESTIAESGIMLEEQAEDIVVYPENLEELKSKIITGLTAVVEGDIELDGTCYATTTIGKRRENQEDAVLLIKDDENPNFKMMVVADGMGGARHGEVASDILVKGLKEWFEGLNYNERASYYTGVTSLQESLNNKINEISGEIGKQLHGMGGATLVCAVIGEHDTMIANVGDSRAYVIKDGKLEQVTIDDAIVQEEFEKGNIPFKDAMRFHHEAAGITECVGMGIIKNIHSTTLSNNDYDMLLLFSDGVTDCLSEDDIAVICKNTNRNEVAKMLVRKAIEHDSIAPEELYADYFDFNMYIPGGKDNSTAAVYIPENDNEEER